MGKFQVIVGNVGTVYDGDNYHVAQSIYVDYILESKHMLSGRVAGESVTLMQNGNIRDEYHGTVEG